MKSFYNRRKFLKSLGSISFAKLFFHAQFLNSKLNTQEPNIVLFISDIHTLWDCGAYGRKTVKTPNIDRLAGESLKFNFAFAASPSCAPSRAAMYTGFIPLKNGAHPNHSSMNPGIKNLPDYLKPLGYETAIIGKTHVKPIKQFPFDTIFIYTADQGAQWPFAKWNLYDLGIRVPFLLCWPERVKKGSETDVIISQVDLLATFLDLAGGIVPNELDSKSFKSVLDNPDKAHYEFIFATHTGDDWLNRTPMRCVRTKKFKYILNLASDGNYTTHIS